MTESDHKSIPQKNSENRETQVEIVKNFFSSKPDQEFLVNDMVNELGVKKPQLSAILRVLIHTGLIKKRQSTRDEHHSKAGKLPFYYSLKK